jgi:uncharacterized protein YuzE
LRGRDRCAGSGARIETSRRSEVKIRYFPDTDTALIEFTQKPVEKTREVSESIYIDLDVEGNLVNMTIEHAKTRANISEIAVQEMQVA